MSINLVYYGITQLTERAKRRIICKAFHAGLEDSAARTRANATSTWKTARNGKPRLDIYVHLGTYVQEGDLVTVEWIWPKYSTDLMSGTAPEAFDVIFDKEVSRFTHRVVFRNVRNPAAFTVRNQGARNFKKQVQGKDVIVEFSAETPGLEQRMGFIADYTRNG